MGRWLIESLKGFIMSTLTIVPMVQGKKKGLPATGKPLISWWAVGDSNARPSD
jgi:hypothetical protein